MNDPKGQPPRRFFRSGPSGTEEVSAREWVRPLIDAYQGAGIPSHKIMPLIDGVMLMVDAGWPQDEAIQVLLAATRTGADPTAAARRAAQIPYQSVDPIRRGTEVLMADGFPEDKAMQLMLGAVSGGRDPEAIARKLVYLRQGLKRR